MTMPDPREFDECAYEGWELGEEGELRGHCEQPSSPSFQERIFLDGAINHPQCRCKPDCEMPCWQRYGLTDEPCGACGCGGPEFKSALAKAGSDA